MRPAQIANKIKEKIPLTARGALTLLASAYVIEQYAIQERDLIAAIVGGTFALLVLICLVITTFVAWRVSRKLSVEFKFDVNDAISKSPVASSILIRGLSLPSYFEAIVRRAFSNEPEDVVEHRVRGKVGENNQRRLLDSLVFPHRGVWDIDGLFVTIGDTLGFTSLTWKHLATAGVEVSAPNLYIQPLPIVAASARMGDDLNISRERSGDPFDIKAYDPSDGVTRILWKTFAKSSQLVVRRPEPAIIPEGEVAIYLVAGRNEDEVASAFLSYMKQLVERQITVLFGTDGFSGESKDSANKTFCSEPEEIRHIINRVVWSSEAGTGRGLSAFLNSLTSAHRFFHQIILFGGEGSSAWISEAAKECAVRNAKATLAMVPRQLGLRLPESSLILGTGISKMSGDRITVERIRSTSTAAMNSGVELLICQTGEARA